MWGDFTLKQYLLADRVQSKASRYPGSASPITGQALSRTDECPLPISPNNYIPVHEISALQPHARRLEINILHPGAQSKDNPQSSRSLHEYTVKVRAVDVVELLPKPVLQLKRTRVYHVSVLPTPETHFAGVYTVRCDGGDEIPGGEDPGRVGGDLDPCAYLWFWEHVRLERSEGG